MRGKMVEPDKRKGLVQLRQSDDGLMHFVWKERPAGRPEIDLIIFPDDAIFRKVVEANARVYLLEFKTSSKKEFFWMQDLSDELDEQRCTEINKNISEPPQPGSRNPVGDLSNLSQDQLLALLAGGGDLNALRNAVQAQQAQGRGTRTAPARSQPGAGTSAPAASSRPQTGAQLGSTIRNILSNLGTGPAAAPRQEPEDKTPQLQDIVNPEEIVNSGLFENEALVTQLAEFLPPGHVTRENMHENIRSAQFQQAVSLFNQALRSGEMATIMTSFGLDATQLGPNPTIEDFLLAVQKQAKKEQDEKK